MCNILVQSFGNGHAQTSLHYFCSTKFLIALLFDNIHFITHTTYYKGGRDKKFKVYEVLSQDIATTNFTSVFSVHH